jgi:hypothetical protein
LDAVLRRQAEAAAKLQDEQAAEARELFAASGDTVLDGRTGESGRRGVPERADADDDPFLTDPDVRIAFEPVDGLDFGTVFDREELSGFIRFVNAGTEPLRIEQIRTTCGCTAVNASRFLNREYLPGEGDSIEVAFTPQTDGLNQKHVIVMSNTAAGRAVRVPIRAEVVPAVKASTSLLRIDDIPVGVPGEASFVLESRDADFEVRSIGTASTRDVFAFDTRRLESDDAEFPGRMEVTITTTESMPVGMFNEQIVVDTIARVPESDKAAETELSVAVRGRVGSLVESATRYMRVPTTARGESFEASLVLTHTEGESFAIESFELDSPVLDVEGLELTVTDSEPGSKVLTLTGVVPEDTRGQRIVGTLTLRFDIKGHGPMDVRFNGAIAGVLPTDGMTRPQDREVDRTSRSQ